MTLSRKVKSVITKPYKKTENFFIPLFNKINNYLDIWFPQDKWNWRKIAVIWAAIQAILITILELYIEYKNYSQVVAIYQYFSRQGESERNTVRLLSFTDSLTVYHMIFIIALFFQLYFVCDTVSKSSIIQLIPQFIVNLGFTIYSIIQYRQAEETKSKDYIAKIDPTINIVINEPKNVEFTIIGLMCLFSIGWAVIDLRLYKVFGWNVFKQLGADIGVKNRLKLYQFFLAFLKIDIFFFTAFAIQFFFFTISYLQNGEIRNKFLNIGLLVICILMPFIGIIGITKENYKIMCIFIVFLSISFGYMVYSLTDIINEKIIENKVSPDKLDEKLFSSYLDMPECPDVDLLIRTRGEQRLSNYLLWHIAYAEQIYCDTLWPDYSNEEFYSHIEAFQHRNRRFGAEKPAAKKGK